MDKQTDLISRLQDEADLCRNDGASDIAALLDEATEALRVDRQPLTREQIDAVMTEHYPLSSLLREEVDAFERCVRDLERLHGIGPNAELKGGPQ